MRYLNSILFGAFLGFTATLLHNAWQPVGLIASLVVTYLGIKLLGIKYYYKRFRLLSAISWLAVVLRGSTVGLGDELLIYGNTYGNLFLLLGFITLVLAVLLPRVPKSSFARRDYL